MSSFSFRQEKEIYCINLYEVMTTYVTLSTYAHSFSPATRPYSLSGDVFFYGHKSLAQFNLDGPYLRTAEALQLRSGLVYGVVQGSSGPTGLRHNPQ